MQDDLDRFLKNPHDAAFKAAFQKKELAAAFFRKYLPESISDLIDYERLEIRNASFVDEAFQDRHSDIVYQTRIRGRIGFLYILFEHQSTPDFFMIFRLLCYMVNLWKSHLDQHPQEKTLPAIFPAVLYHGRRKWNAPFTLGEIIDAGPELDEYIPHFSYQLYDLRDYEDERLLLGDYLAIGVVLYLMKHIFDDDFESILTQVIQSIQKMGDRKAGLEFLEWAMRYTYHARNESKDVLTGYIHRASQHTGNEETRRVAMSLAERLIQEGKELGFEEGKAAILMKQINKRFGRIPPALEHKLRASKPEVVDQFGESLFDFQSLEDVEKWWEKHEARS